ncbi:MAG: DUF1499 domain-containing protein [Rubrobacter sp.]|jgi:uncharacterized protein (DUF1499 family)|nr:DUF1499 domain-containing protein [Rubrobacter sp.]
MKDIERTGPKSARAEVSYEVPAEKLASAIERAIHTSKRWRLGSSSNGTIKAVRTTRIFKFEDDITIKISGDDENAHAVFESASRVGNSDLGQNRRNLRELLPAIERELG